MKTQHFVSLLSLALIGLSDLSLGITRDPARTNRHLLPPRHNKSLTIPSEAEIRLWARSRGVPVLVIDPSQIDTSRFTGWYSPNTTIPLGTTSGEHLLIGDVDGNRLVEFYGYYTPDVFPHDLVARIYEIDSISNGSFRYTYLPFPGMMTGLEDINADGLTECVWLSDFGSKIRAFTQPMVDSLPTAFFFDFSLEAPFSVNVAPVFADLNGDKRPECIYLTGAVDSSDTIPRIVGIAAIARYDDSLRTLKQLWHQIPSGYGISGGFPVADFDGDGAMEFAAVSDYSGTVAIFEYLDDSTVVQRFEDTTPLVNLFYMAAGDVDSDSRPELFVTATSDGNWTLVYEASSDNTYRLQLVIHFLAGGIFDEPDFFTADMNNDGKVEFVCTAGSWIIVLRGDSLSDYSVWYARKEDQLNSLAIHDANHDGRLDLITSRQRFDSLGFVSYYSTLQLASELTDVEPSRQIPIDLHLYQNFPNPFNSATAVTFTTQRRAPATISILDLLGREVAIPWQGNLEPGSHRFLWSPSGMSTGVYLCRLQVGQNSSVIKMLLLK